MSRALTVFWEETISIISFCRAVKWSGFVSIGRGKKRTTKVCKRWMDGTDVELAALAAGWLLSNDSGSPEAEQVYWQCVDSARPSDVESRLRTARLLSLGPPGDRARVALSALLHDEDSRVLSAAIESCGVLKPVDEIGRREL